MFIFSFFFSSRRRHTRSLRDWSSDVCSSYLGSQCSCWVLASQPHHLALLTRCRVVDLAPDCVPQEATQLSDEPAFYLDAGRSEERRVGKECRSRWSP